MYGLSNGVDSENELVEKITYFARRRSQNFSPSTDPIIGCIELVDVITRGRHRNGSPAVYFGGHDLKPGDGGGRSHEYESARRNTREVRLKSDEGRFRSAIFWKPSNWPDVLT